MSNSNEAIQDYFGDRRTDLVRFATLQLRDPALAEDVVQETLMAALRSAGSFGGRSSLKTWVFAILRRKIIDAMRSRSREVAFSQLEFPVDEPEELEALFNERGFWARDRRPQRWVDPEDSLEQEQFWRIFELCLDYLPERTGRVFAMRELLGLETDEICKELGISPSNCWVILHRARMGLRLCLEERWFGDGGRNA